MVEMSYILYNNLYYELNTELIKLSNGLLYELYIKLNNELRIELR